MSNVAMPAGLARLSPAFEHRAPSFVAMKSVLKSLVMSAKENGRPSSARRRRRQKTP